LGLIGEVHFALTGQFRTNKGHIFGGQVGLGGSFETPETHFPLFESTQQGQSGQPVVGLIGEVHFALAGQFRIYKGHPFGGQIGFGVGLIDTPATHFPLLEYTTRTIRTARVGINW